MTVAATYPHIEIAPDGVARLRRLPRIRVAQIVMDYLAHGWSAEEMCRQHPNLKLAETHIAMAYYFDHEAEIDEQIKKELEEVEKARAATPPSPFLLRMRAKGLR